MTTFETSVLTALEVQAKAQAEQAKAQAEQAKAQAEQAKSQAVFQATVLKEFGIVREKLESIEKDVLVIKGAVISDFAGIEPSTKADLENTVESIQITPEEIVEFQQSIGAKTVVGVAFRKVVNSFTSGKVLASYDPKATKGEKAACGNFVGNVMTKIYGIKFGGKYPIPLRPVVALLVGYYAVERVSMRMY